MGRLRSARDALAYYWAVLRRGVGDTLQHVSAVGIVAGVVLFLLGSGLGCRWTAGACDATSLRAGLAAVGIYVSAIFLANLVMAPARMHRELRAGVAESEEQPLVVEYISHQTALVPPYCLDGWEFEAYETADGIGLVWRSRDTSMNIGSSRLPSEVVCRITPSAGGQGHTVSLKPKWEAQQVACIYPRDSPGAVPTTGSIEVQWLARKGETGWVPLPPLEVLRGQRPPTPVDATMQRLAADQMVICATLSVKLRARRGGDLV